MNILPQTTLQDIANMGYTVADVSKALEVDPNTVKSLYLPSRPDETRDPARNYTRSDWREIQRRTPEIIDSKVYEQSFRNFESVDPVEPLYSHSVSETEGNDYTETLAFDVSVNASMGIGLAGPMFGFSASMSASEVKAKSSSRTEERSISYPIHVPAGEGRKVTETTLTWATDILYEAQIATRGPLGVDTFDFRQIFFVDVEQSFPNNFVGARIARRVIGTSVDVTISNIPPPTGLQDSRPADGDIMFFHCLTSSNLTGLNPAEKIEARSASPLEDPGFAVAQQALTINFLGYGDQGVPAGQRAQRAILFRTKLVLDSRQLGALAGGFSVLDFDPNQAAPDNVKLRISYDNSKVSRIKLRERIVYNVRLVNWAGLYLLEFV